MNRTRTYLSKLCTPVGCAVLLVVMAQAASAATVHGRLVHAGNGYPAAGVPVTVYNQNLGRSSPANSGPDGMYYLYNVPAGNNNYLEVWMYPGAQPVVYQIQVVEPYTDIPQIAVP